MSKKLKILVTGSSRGIGKAIALELAKKGHILAINNNIRTDEVNQTLNIIRKYSPKSIKYMADVSNHKQVIQMMEFIKNKFGGIDVLVNNAGLVKDKTLKNLDYDDWIRVIDVNLNGIFNCMKSALPGMIENKYGRIINISSVVGFTGNIGQSNYAASKAGVIGLTKSLALEVARYGITVNAIAPGFIETEMIKGIPKKYLDEIIQKIPLKRLGYPNEVAHVVQFLMDDKSNYITGQTIHINGGFYL